MEERLQKVLSRAGVSSRRKAEELIAAGRVSVDGRIVKELGSKVDPRRSRVELDGKRLVADPFVYIVLHKPRGMMSTLSDPEGRPTVVDALRALGVRVYPVGRLDYHTSGVLLLTNDGEFSSALQHPRTGAPKIYVAKVQGELEETALERWRESIMIDGRATQPASVRLLRHENGKTWLEVTLREGRNRQVRRLGEHTGALVMRLARQSYAGVTVEALRPGEWRHLTKDELTEIKKQYGVPKKVRPPAELEGRPSTPRGKPRRATAGKTAHVPKAGVSRAAGAAKPGWAWGDDAVADQGRQRPARARSEGAYEDQGRRGAGAPRRRVDRGAAFDERGGAGRGTGPAARQRPGRSPGRTSPQPSDRRHGAPAPARQQSERRYGASAGQAGGRKHPAAASPKSERRYGASAGQAAGRKHPAAGSPKSERRYGASAGQAGGRKHAGAASQRPERSGRASVQRDAAGPGAARGHAGFAVARNPRRSLSERGETPTASSPKRGFAKARSRSPKR